MADTFPLVLDGGATLTAVEIDADEGDALGPALRGAGVPTDVPVLVVVGGAGGMDAADLQVLGPTFDELVELVEERGGVAVDGGTNAGVMRLLGEARQRAGASFPLIGVAASGTIALPGRPPPSGAADVDPGHTHLVVVPGSDWGDESPWIARVATAIARGAPSVTLLVNGGEVAYVDVANSLREQRPVVAVDGSGRTADDVAAAVRGDDTATPRARQLASSGLTTAADLSDRPTTVASVARRLHEPRG